MEIFEELLHRAYGAYRQRWLLERGHTLEEIDEDIGLPGGECYVCFSEFQQNEFKDPEIVKTLLTPFEYQTYLRLTCSPTRETSFFWDKDQSLYDFLQQADQDYDTADTDYDCIVTVCADSYEPDGDKHTEFCRKLLKLVEIDSFTPDGRPIVKWSTFIVKNREKFLAFSKEYWRYSYEDCLEEFTYQWICELHNYLAGYVSDDIYKALCELLDSCTD